MSRIPAIYLHKGREKSVLRRHPWVFSGAIRRVETQPQPGALVDVRSHDGTWLARGLWSPESEIRVRLLSWDETEEIDEGFWRARLERAIAGRAELATSGHSSAYRLVHAESDGIPGLIVDRYGDWLVLQALAIGIEIRKGMLARLLDGLLRPRGIYERSDEDVRLKEGLRLVNGPLLGEEPPELIEVFENGHVFAVDVRRGHKTGFYLDQRENRALLGDILRLDRDARRKTVLNAFAYTCGFAVYALDGLAQRVINVDSSADVLDLGRHNLALNGLEVNEDDFVVGDVFRVLREYRDRGESFDIIVLDPPKFARNAAQIGSAARGYKDINLLAFKLLRPGGLLMTFSCSGVIGADLFQKIVFGALLDSGREAQVLRHLGAGPDHPVALTFPEGAYLKGLLCRVW